MGILGLAPLHSQKHGYGSRRQRQLTCSCFAERCRGVGRGCVELVVNETVEEPTNGVRGTFLCVFNAMKHDRIWILYIWEDVKFRVTFGMLQLSYYKDFWNKQGKKSCLGCVCEYSCFFFWAWREEGEAGAPPGWETPLEMYGLETSEPNGETPQVPRCWVHCVWSSRGRWDNNWSDVLPVYPMVIC